MNLEKTLQNRNITNKLENLNTYCIISIDHVNHLKIKVIL